MCVGGNFGKALTFEPLTSAFANTQKDSTVKAMISPDEARKQLVANQSNQTNQQSLNKTSPTEDLSVGKNKDTLIN